MIAPNEFDKAGVMAEIKRNKKQSSRAYEENGTIALGFFTLYSFVRAAFAGKHVKH